MSSGLIPGFSTYSRRMSLTIESWPSEIRPMYMPTMKASPFARMSAVLKSQISVATGEPDTRRTVAATSSFVIQSRLLRISSVTGSIVDADRELIRAPPFPHPEPEHEIPEPVDREPLARVNRHGRGRVLDERGALDGVARLQARAVEDRGIVALAAEVDGPRLGERVVDVGPVRLDLLELRVPDLG